MKEVYISIDVEADGPIPGVNSMLSLGAAAFIRTPLPVNPECRTHHYGHRDEKCICQGQPWQMLDTFSANLNQLEGATPFPATMDWWKTQPEAWAEATRDQQHPERAMWDFVQWVQKMAQHGAPVLVGYPVTYDFMFVYWYTVKFTGFPAPFGFQGLDIKTLVMDRLGCAFKHSAKRNMPQRWFKGAPKHTHKAVDDAIGQGVLLMNILTEYPGTR